jgi:hypothetical protein
LRARGSSLHRKAQDIFVLVIAALVIGSALPYKALIEPLPDETDNGPEVEIEGEPFYAGPRLATIGSLRSEKPGTMAGALRCGR